MARAANKGSPLFHSRSAPSLSGQPDPNGRLAPHSDAGLTLPDLLDRPAIAIRPISKKSIPDANDMSTEDYPLLHFADGVIVAPRPPKNGQSLPTPAGTRVTLTQEDGNGNPSLQIFFPAIWHSRPSALDPLASRLRHLSLTGEPRPVRAGSGLCTICDRVGEYILSSRLAKAWGPFADKVRSLENNTIDLPHVLIMGDLADIMRTPDCSLCHLVSTACRSIRHRLAVLPTRLTVFLSGRVLWRPSQRAHLLRHPERQFSEPGCRSFLPHDRRNG